MIKLTVEGVVYEFDDAKMLIAEAREIKKLTGLSIPKMFAGAEEADADAIAALIFLAKKRAGETLRFSDLDSLDYADIQMEVVEQPDEDASASNGSAGAAADPTPPSGNGMIPTDGTGVTSPLSPTTSSTPQPTLVP